MVTGVEGMLILLIFCHMYFKSPGSSGDLFETLKHITHEAICSQKHVPYDLIVCV